MHRKLTKNVKFRFFSNTTNFPLKPLLLFDFRTFFSI